MTVQRARTGGASTHILVVDNDPRVRAALSAVIGSSPGLAILGEASSRLGAYEAIDSLRPDVVVLDILLPTAQDGLEVLQHLAACGRPAIALSIREDLREAAFAAGAVAFVAKYSGPDALLRTLRDVVATAPERD